MVKPVIAALALAGALAPLHAQPPQLRLSNGKATAVLYLPDAENGYYRATRFDWAGAIASLEAGGHSYFGKWFDRYDPKINDAITGPVEEFLSGDSSLGYDEAKTGGVFVRIGVGALRKPEEEKFQRFKTYEIVNAGRRTERHGADWVELTHELADTNGYAYLYTKRLALTAGKAELVIEHSLKNTGAKPIDTSVYNHDFYMLDGQPTGPDIVVKFAFPPQAATPLGALAEVRGNELHYLSELQARQAAYTDFTGFGDTAAHNDFRVENRKTGAGVHQSGDLPVSKLVFWSIRTTVCPEAYVHLHVEPGKTVTWKIRYEFYSL